MRLYVITTLFALLLVDNSANAFGLHAGSDIAIGHIGDSDQSVLSRSMGALDFQIMPGYRMGPVLLGVSWDYRIVNQVQPKASNNDMSGTGTDWGVGASFEPLLWKFLFNYDVSSKYSVAASGYIYKGSGFRALIGYQALPHFYIDLVFLRTSYNDLEIGSLTPVDLSSDPLSYWNFGIGVSLSL